MSDPPEPRTIRGINRIQDLSVGEFVEFNQFGQAVGQWQYLCGKYIGTRTRRLISILKKDWKQVTKEEKNFLWSNIKVPWSNEHPLENKELNAIIIAWVTLWRD
uniref:Homeobox protein knotted-1-like LET6 isoform X1 n=1 Tax=Tanacetum cinerariifolium TaxID=118510 RepID=A0A699HCG6_TANCI|nr:homeobox protein knotted-1-like LET6 isoform X1 [Tanacetum cinerariifolium]